MRSKMSDQLGALVGRRLGLRLYDGSRLDDCRLVSLPGGRLVNTARAQAFTPPSQLVAVGWWPVDDDRLDDISDLAMWDGRVFLLSDQSGCVARLAADDLALGADAELDAVWTLPDELGKAEGLTFAGDGQVYVGFDVDLEDRPNGKNLVRFAALPPAPRGA